MSRGAPVKAPKAVRIIGGGLAGLSLGLQLRRAGVPVALWEAGRYPRHRVCGEFVSGRGRDLLRELGWEDRFLARRAVLARTASFHSSHGSGSSRLLPEPALCLSRHAMDALLVEEFQTLGGTLHTGQRWTGTTTEPGTVLAIGRRPAAAREGWRWFGLKAHALGLELASDLEMHLGTNGYVGLCRLADDRVNVCGLFRSRADEAAGPVAWRERLTGPPGTPLHARLSGAVFDEASVCAVAGLDLVSVPEFSPTEARVGDAVAMIPPVTGNGMSMAFESAHLAAPILADWAFGRFGWMDTTARLALAHESAFATRLRIARTLQRLLFLPGTGTATVSAVNGLPGLMTALFHLTR